jgi:predicted RecA/RadA family phage recombinase
MAKTYLQHGEIIAVTAPAAVTSGDPVLIGTNLFGVALADADSGAGLEIATLGVWSLPKATSADATEAWSAGDPVYFVSAAGNLSKVAAGNTLIGVAIADAAADATSARVRLHGQAG